MQHLQLKTQVKLKTKAVSQRYQQSLNNQIGELRAVTTNNEYIVRVNGEDLPFSLEEICTLTGKPYSKIYSEDEKKLLAIVNKRSIATFQGIFTRETLIEIAIEYGEILKAQKL